MGDILDAIEKIQGYTQDHSAASFIQDPKTLDAVIRNFEIIGEATKRVSSEVRIANPEIPWKQMAGLRDKLIHEYIKVNLQLIWDVVTDILPEQKNQIERILSDIER